jgi:hypothetical protein
LKVVKKVFIVVIVIILVLCFGITIYYLGNSLIRTTEFNVNTEVGGDYKEVIGIIMTATDNAINKIYNILVVSTIFFTLLIGTVSLFQYLKIKDIEEFKKEFKTKLDDILNDFNIKIEPAQVKIANIEKQFNEKMLEYDIKIEEINNLKSELSAQKSELERKSAELEIEVCLLKAKDAFEKKYHDNIKIRIDEYLKILNTKSLFDDIISDERLAVVYNNLANAYEDSNNNVDAQKYYNMSLNKNLVDKERSVVFSNLARLSFKEKQLKKALDYCNKAYEFDEANVFLYIWKAVVLAQESAFKNVDEAFDDLSWAFEINPNITRQHINIIKEQNYISDKNLFFKLDKILKGN